MGKTKHDLLALSPAYWQEEDLIKKNANALLYGLYQAGSLDLSRGTKIITYAYEDKIIFETQNTNPAKKYNLSYSKITNIEKTIKTQPDNSFKVARESLEEHFCNIKYSSDEDVKHIEFLYKTANWSHMNYNNKHALICFHFFDFVSSKIQNGNETEVTDL